MTTKWKDTERLVASVMGGKRKIDKGKHTEAEDVEHSLFSVEVKHRHRMPPITESYAQAARNATDGKVPLVVYRYPGDTRLYAILDLADLMALVPGEVADDQG